MRLAITLPARLLALTIGLLVVLPLAPAIANAASGQPATPVASLDSATCLSCHDGKQKKLEVPSAGGEPRPLHAVNPDKYGKSVHSTMQCVACHTDITDAVAPHQKTSVPKPDCVQCHTDLWEKAKKANLTREKARLGVVVQNIDAYQKSFHAKPNKEDKSHVNATCDNCHDTHTFNVPPSGTSRRADWHLTVPSVCGEKCHTDELKQYNTSVHGQAINKEHNLKAAVCTDCHSAHAIGDTSADPTRLTLTDKCGSCHEASKKTYLGTFHGQISNLGYANTAKCYDCHGGHGILKADNPKSKVNPQNLLKTCRQCHSDKMPGMYNAPPGFASFQPHGHADFKRYPEIWIATQIMNQLLIGTFAFFWIHTLLWFYRESKERRHRKLQPHVKVDRRLAEIPEPLHGKHFQRFTRTWRIAHLTFAISLMLLTLTGIPLFFHDAIWAKPLMNLLGGPQIAGTIHRVNAVIFAGVFFWHLIYITVKIARDWKNFKIFGPNSMVPGPQDLKDIIAMFKWFFGMAPRPVFDRWTYWEKFDYWAPFWGVTIIGVSGLMMWIPNVTGQYLPGWVFNVATIFHGDEAFLAVVFLFTVHFFNNHFRPDKFPLELVMFTGTMTLEDFKHDHALEYQRMVESGELEKHLVDAPSPRMVSASRVLGFTLIAAGLTLLTLVGIGFFSSL